jgi:hypothetical protein
MEVLVRLTEADPTASRERLFKKWQNIIHDDADLREAVDQYTFTNMLSSLDRDRRDTQIRRQNRIAPISEEKQQAIIKNVKHEMIRTVIHFVRPLTFGECLRAGGLMAKIGKMGLPDKIVGETLDENKLFKILAAK